MSKEVEQKTVYASKDMVHAENCVKIYEKSTAVSV